MTASGRPEVSVSSRVAGHPRQPIVPRGARVEPLLYPLPGQTPPIDSQRVERLTPAPRVARRSGQAATGVREIADCSDLEIVPTWAWFGLCGKGSAVRRSEQSGCLG